MYNVSRMTLFKPVLLTKMCLPVLIMSPVLRKPDFCLGENKGAHQLRSNCKAYQRLCFRNADSTIKFVCLFRACTARVVSDLVGNPEDRDSRVAAQLF